LPVLARINPGNDLEGLIESEGVGCVVAGDDQIRLQAYATQLADESDSRSAVSARCRALVTRMFAPHAAVVTSVPFVDRS
jgi:hypothetical protein